MERHTGSVAHWWRCSKNLRMVLLSLLMCKPQTTFVAVCGVFSGLVLSQELWTCYKSHFQTNLLVCQTLETILSLRCFYKCHPAASLHMFFVESVSHLKSASMDIWNTCFSREKRANFWHTHNAWWEWEKISEQYTHTNPYRPQGVEVVHSEHTPSHTQANEGIRLWLKCCCS